MMSRWDDAWAGADSDVLAEMGQEVTVDGVPVVGAVTDREGGATLKRGGVSEGQGALG